MTASLMPREKLLRFGASALSDEELLAIFLRTGVKNCPVMALSHQVLKEFGSLRSLMAADQKSFCKVKGLGVTHFIQLQAMTEMTRRYLHQQLQQRPMFNSQQATKLYLQATLEHKEREVFFVLFLDNQLRLLKAEEMFLGTVNAAAVYPREVIKTALLCNAAAIILAHNHPSGVATPSQSDHQITQDILRATKLMNIRLVDHFIIGKGCYYSFAEAGKLGD